MNQTLRQKCASHKGDRQLQCSDCGQSVKTTEIAQSVGYDGGSWVLGHKRHIVDTLGLLLEVVVSAANVSEKAGAVLLEDQGQFPQHLIFADGGYDGKDFMASVKEDYQLDWESSSAKEDLALAVDSKTLALVNALPPVNY